MNHLKTASPGACRFVLLVLLAMSARLSHAADLTPPTIPTNFTAVVAACSRVDLNWDPATDPKGPQSGLGGYKIYRNASVIATLGSVTSFSDTNLLASTQYSYNVSALDIAGNESPLSSVVAVTPCADTTAPGSPASITPSVVNSSRVDISWAGATDNSGAKYETVSGIKTYQVFRNGTNANNKIADVVVPSTFFSDLGLAANQTVYYAVRAVDNNNNVSAFRVSSSVTTSFGAPGSITGLTASTPNCRSVHLDWNAPASVGSGLAYYQVFRDGAALQQTSSTGLNDNSVNPGASYTYSVAAVDTGGRSSAPQPLLVTVPGCPALLASNLTIDMDNGNRMARLHWSGTPGALYQAQCASTFFGPWIPVDAPTTEFSVTNLAAQPSSIYRVAIFTNTPVYTANFITNIYDTAAPPTPANLSVNAVSDTEASLTWDAVTDNGTTDLSGNTYTSGIDRYLIYRDGIFLKNAPPSAISSSDTTVEADATYTYTLASIDKAGNRSGFIGATVQIKNSCAYTLSYAAMTFGSAGGSSNATVNAGPNCPWSASTGNSWLHSSGSGNGNGNLSLTVDANTSASPRQGTISVGNKTLSITQNGLTCSYTLIPSGANHGSDAENGGFSILSPAGCNWSSSADAPWLHTSSSGSGNGTVTYTVDANPGTGPRSGQILAGDQAFSVSQAGIYCSYSIFPSSNNHGAGAENGSFLVSTPGGCAWSASTIASWIHTTSTGSGNGTASYTIDANGSTSARSAQIVVGGQSFTVNQSGISCTYSFSSSANSHGAGAENGSFSITTPNGCAWSASPSATWIHTSSSGTGNGTVSYSIDSNGSTTSRSGQILVGGQSFTVNQAGEALTLGGALDNTGLTWTSGGNAPWAAENSVAFSAGAAAQSGAIGNAQLTWLETTVTGPSTLSFYWKVSSETGYDLLHFYLDGVEQTGVAAISGEVDWQPKSVAIGAGAHVAHWEYAKDGVCCSGGADAGWVDQVQVTASACDYSISSGSASVAASGGPGSFTVTTSAGCAWSASTSFGWIHTGSAGSGSGTVSFTVDANGLTGARSGTIIVGGQTYSISQAGADCIYGLGSSSASYNSAAASGSFTVTAGAGCGWAASSAAGWIHTTSGGTGNGTVNYSLDANTSGAARSGIISVAGQSFQVNQSVDAAPVANAGPDISVSVGAIASFNAGASSDADGSIASYQWDFGDGTTGSGVAVTHAYGLLGVYTVRLTVTDDLGATGTDAALATIVALPDLTPPTVSLALAGSTNVSGIVTLTATASDNVSVAKVEFYRDGVLFTNDTTSPYIVTFDTRTLGNGVHTFLAKAYDPSNNNNSSSVTVLVDNTAPTTALTSPSNGSTASNTITLTASATDNSGGSGVARVEFYSDNNPGPIGTATAAPWTAPCDTTLMANGSHTFYSKAYDLAGNSTTSPTVTVTVNNTVAVNPGQLLWLKTMLCQNGNAVATGIVADHAGNVIVVGYFNGTVNLGGGPISSTFANNVTDGFIVKYTPDGTLVWIKRFGGSGNDSAQAVVVDSQNNIIVAGNFQGTVDFGGGPITAVTSSEMFAVKYSTSGGFMWGNHYNGLTSNTGSSMAIDASDNVVLAANCGYNANFGGTLLTPAGGAADIDVALGKISSSTGATLWAKRFGGVNWDYVRAVAVDRSGDIVVVGYFTSSTDLGAGTVNGGGGFDIFLAKFSGANGAYRWGKTMGGTGGDFGYGVAIDPNTGNAVMTGLYAGSVDFGGGLTGSGGLFLAAYDPTGNFLWARTTGAGSDSGAAITIDSNGNMAVTGRANNALYFGGSQSLFGNGQVNCFVASFTVSGANSTPTYRWTKYLGEGTDGASAGNGVALDPTGQVLVGGNFLATIDFGGVTATAAMAGYSSGFLAKYAR